MSGDPGQECLAVSVREVAWIFQLVERRQGVSTAIRERPSHPHRRLRGIRPDGHVLGHSFYKPQRKLCCPWQRPGTGRAAMPCDVVLEGVSQLVANHVVEVA